MHTHGATSFSRQLRELGTRRRSRRRLIARGGIHLQRDKEEICVVGPQCDPARRADQVGLDRRQRCVAFLFRMLRCGDALAELAGMSTIESLRDGFRERRVLRVLHDHARPSR